MTKVARSVYSLVLADGRRLSVSANNRVEAFDAMELLWPVLVAGYSFRDLISY